MKILFSIAATMMATTGFASAAEPETYAFQYQPGSTSCRVDYPRSDGISIAFMLLDSGMLGTGVIKEGWDIAEGQNLERSDYKLTLDWQGVGTTTAPLAAYIQDEKSGVFGMWTPGDGAGSVTEAMDLLTRGQVVTVSFEGRVLGTFDLHNKAFTANLLKTCSENFSK